MVEAFVNQDKIYDYQLEVAKSVLGPCDLKLVTHLEDLWHVTNGVTGTFQSDHWADLNDSICWRRKDAWHWRLITSLGYLDISQLPSG